MTHRSGMTTLETLMAIFVFAVGAIAVMGMFPLSVVTMGHSFRIDRATTSAGSAEGYIRIYWKEKMAESANPNAEPAFRALDADPDGPGPLTAILATSTDPSYPVFIDPVGWWARGGPTPGRADRDRVGENGLTNIPRRNLNALATNDLIALRATHLMDTMSYTDDGVPKPGADMRELRYNWLWVIQRPMNRDRFTANLTIVVFNKRTHLYAPQGIGLERVTPMPGEPAVPFVPGLTSITVPASVDVDRGSWILDATILPGTVNSFAAGGGPIRHAKFYRVVSKTETPNLPGFFDLELHTPIRRLDGSSAPYNGTVVVLAGVSEVFERPALTSSGQ